MKKRVVIALGGNALGNTPEEQLILVKNTAKSIVSIIEEGYEVIIGHGNGPQVGMINLAMSFASNSKIKTPYMPFAECGAMSQGYIGYHLQQAIYNELSKKSIKKNVSTVITQVVVDKNDSAFSNPTKPIGRFYSKEEADKIALEKNFKFIEDSGRGYRRVISSPEPTEIIELDVIKQLLNQGNIVITVGGGGIPVIKTNDGLEGVDAVIDKDKSSAKLAKDLNADILIILTAVDRVYINFNKKNQEELKEITVEKATKYIKEDQFGKGSMLPKIEACIDFVKNSEKIAIITSLENALKAINKETGTVIKE